jgi:hypothetical protein
MRPGTIGALLCALASSSAWGQGKDKEFEKKVDQAVAEFSKAYKAGTVVAKAQAIPLLKGLVHDKVFAQLAPCIKDDPLVRLEALKVLAEMDHPKSAKLLAESVALNKSSLEHMKVLLKASETVVWDEFYGSFAKDFAKQAFDGVLYEIYWYFMDHIDKNAAIACVDGLILVFHEIDEGRRFGFKAPNDEFENKMMKCFKTCTGESKGYNEIKAFWNSNRGSVAAKCKNVMWCPLTGKRWERKPGDAKAACPHHEDKKTKCSSVVALTSNKP